MLVGPWGWLVWVLRVGSVCYGEILVNVGNDYRGMHTDLPTRCALPIQDLCVCGSTTLTVCPCFCSVDTKECTYGEDWSEGGPSSLVTFKLVSCCH